MSQTTAPGEAEALFRAGRYADAAILYASLSANTALEQAQWLLQRGICALRTGDPRKGVSLLAEAALLAPEDGRIRYKYGLALARVGRHADALEELRRAVALAPQIAEHHFRLAFALRSQGDEAGAVAAFTRCLNLDPAHQPARDALAAPPSAAAQAAHAAKAGKSCFAQGHFDDALEYFERALALDPGNAHFVGMADKARSRLGAA